MAIRGEIKSIGSYFSSGKCTEGNNSANPLNSRSIKSPAYCLAG
jgi:hypothetical protein